MALNFASSYGVDSLKLNIFKGMYRFLLLLFLLISSLPCLAKRTTYLQFPTARYLKVGDDLRWKEVDFDHQDWALWGNTTEIGIFWIRFEFTVDSITQKIYNPGLQVTSMGAYECYWNGQLIATNGKVGSSKGEEVPGTLMSQVSIPDSLLNPGKHLIAFRVSNHYKWFKGMNNWNTIYLEEYRYTQSFELKRTSGMFILAGIFLMAGIYYLLLFLLRKREGVTFIFSILCFLFFIQILAEYSKFLWNYLYPFQMTRLSLIFATNFLISFLTPLFFMRYFQVPRQRLLIPFVLIVLVVISMLFLPGTDDANQRLSSFMWFASLGVVGFAVYKKRKESRIMLGSLLLAGLFIWFNEIRLNMNLFSYDVNLFLAFGIVVIAMMYLLARRAREQKLAYESSLVLSARLQNELLKKNIQPHFIMNTLTSLMEWVEESPQDSVNFIEALSREFEIMSNIAEQKMIPLEQEVDLIRQHIAIMKFRKEVNYLFTHEGLDLNAMVPPAIFHTIVENGITHSLPDEHNEVRLHLKCVHQEESVVYELRTFAQIKTIENPEEGTGLKYVRSRLQECYADGWRLSSQAMKDGWLTRIQIYHKYA